MFFLLTAALLAACGQYGGLYPPEQTASPQQAEEESEQEQETEMKQPEDL